MKINIGIVNNVTYENEKIVKKLFALWATQNNKI
jgi:hypothetical protein